MPDLAGDCPMLGFGGALDRGSQGGVHRDGNLLSAVLRLGHAAILEVVARDHAERGFFPQRTGSGTGWNKPALFAFRWPKRGAAVA
jgi:hypothetical protein